MPKVEAGAFRWDGANHIDGGADWTDGELAGRSETICSADPSDTAALGQFYAGYSRGEF